MTHSLSTFDADRPPAMYRSATLAIVVSSTSMNVGMTTATATNQGLTAGRLAAAGARASLLMRGLLREDRVLIGGRSPDHPSPLSGCRGFRTGRPAVARRPRRRAPW